MASPCPGCYDTVIISGKAMRLVLRPQYCVVKLQSGLQKLRSGSRIGHIHPLYGQASQVISLETNNFITIPDVFLLHLNNPVGLNVQQANTTMHPEKLLRLCRKACRMLCISDNQNQAPHEHAHKLMPLFTRLCLI